MDGRRLRGVVLRSRKVLHRLGGNVSLKMLFLHLPPCCACDERGGGDEEMGKGFGDRKIWDIIQLFDFLTCTQCCKSTYKSDLKKKQYLSWSLEVSDIKVLGCQKLLELSRLIVFPCGVAVGAGCCLQSKNPNLISGLWKGRIKQPVVSISRHV